VRGPEFCVGTNFPEPVCDFRRPRVDIHPVQLLCVGSQLGQEDTTAIANFQK